MFLRCTSTHSLVLRSNDSTDKINSDLGTVALARPKSHTGCTQALRRELGVRNGGCESHLRHGSATAASRALQERSERGRISQEMSWLAPETGDFVPCHRHASFGSLMKAKKKKKIGRYDLNCISTGFKVGLTSMLRNCVSFFYAMHALSHVVPVHTQSANCSHPAHSQADTALRHISLQCACASLFS